MTTAALAPSVEYLENGVSLAFPVPFRFRAPGHIEVKRIAAAGPVTALALGVDYSVTGGATDAGGTLTLTSSIAGARLKIRRLTPREQQSEYETGSNFPAATLEDNIDQLTLIAQEQDVLIGDTALRALLVPEGEGIATVPTLAQRAARVLGFNGVGQPVEGPLLDALALLVTTALSTLSIGPASSVPTVAGLQALLKATLTDGDVLNVLGRNTVFDGGGGLFRWVEGDGAAEDGGTVFEAGEGGAGRWKRIDTNRVNIKWFGAIGDGVTDDHAAIQAAIDYAGLGGAGVEVWVPRSPGGFRITRGLKLPTYVGLVGDTPSRYPFAASNPNVSKIVADFDDPLEWIIEPKTAIGGFPVAHDGIIAGAFPDGATYNCSVRNLIITSVGELPYGGIRMHGCPGAVIDEVAIYRVGCGVLFNYSFGGECNAHIESAYYGEAWWGEANANKTDCYCARLEDYIGEAVPADYLLSFMAAFDGSMVGTLKLSTNDHYDRAWGVLIGSTSSTTASIRGDMTIERYDGGLFLANASSFELGGVYIEGGVGVVNYGVAISQSTGSISALHEFLSGTGNAFDFGHDMDAYINASGPVYAAAFGKLPEIEASSQLRLGTVKPGFLGQGNQFNVLYVDKASDWITVTLPGGLANVGAPNSDAMYRRTQLGIVQLRGAVTGVTVGGVIFTLPPGWRPYRTWPFNQIGGEIEIRENGEVAVTSGGPVVVLDGIEFEQVG